MQRMLAPSAGADDIGFDTLLAYEQALRDFTSSRKPRLTFDAFAGLSAVRAADLPPLHALVAQDGVRLAFRRHVAATPVRLLLIHGSGCFADQFHTLARAIAGSGVAEVITLDIRGHGQSGGERGHAVRYPGQIVDDIGDAIATFAAAEPGRITLLGGHSAGGGVALAVARSPASRLIAGYILLAPFLGLGSPTVRPYFGGWVSVRPNALRLLTLANAMGSSRFNDHTVIDFNMDACLHDPRFVRSWSFGTTLAFGPGRWRTDLPPVPAHIPVLLLAGRRDQCFHADRYRAALDVISPHAEAPDVGATGHFDILADMRTIETLQAWIARRYPATSATPQRESVRIAAA